jgi:hypothetical protein
MAMIGAAWASEPTSVIVPPKLIKQVAVKPPKFGIVGAASGWVVACYVITVQGKVRDVTFPDSGAFDYLEIPIKRALVRWRFEPALRDGVPIEHPACTKIDVRAIGG